MGGLRLKRGVSYDDARLQPVRRSSGVHGTEMQVAGTEVAQLVTSPQLTKTAVTIMTSLMKGPEAG